MWLQNKPGQREGMRSEQIGYRQEIVGVIVGAIFLFLCIALISYSPRDNSLFHYGGSRHVTENWAGLIGSHIAAFLYLLFGVTVYGLLALLLVPVYRRFAGFSVQQRYDRWQWWLRYVAMCGVVFACALVLDAGGITFYGGPAGGMVGSLSAAWLAIWIGSKGVFVCAVALFWVGLCYGLQISLASLALVCWGVLRKCLEVIGQGLKLCVWRLSAASKNQSRQEPEADQSVIPASSQEDDFWAAVIQAQGNVGQQPGQGQTPAMAGVDERIASDEQGFAKKKVATTSRRVRFFGAPYLHTPNSVLSKNIFVGGDEQLSLYARLLKVNVGTSLTKKRGFHLPEIEQDVLASAPYQHVGDDGSQRSKMLESKLLHFGVKGQVTAVKPGPVITLFEYKPEIDSKISKITALEDDLAMALTANSIRIIAPIPGKDAVGFEIANNVRSDVLFDSIVHSKEWATAKARLPIILGVDVVGNPVIQDLASMPHLLVGGSTGSGKSVGLNVILMSLLYKLSPDMLRLILIDPKRLEFTPYADIPHLLFPIVTQPDRAISVLKWVVHEMEQRYECMAKAGVRNMSEYHAWYREACKTSKKDAEQPRALPFLVVMIDELADLMMVGGRDVETQIVRIVQMARAAGIHMIIATQRPSVDVVTGLIKINFPSRIAFRVSSKVDSRTILDCQGAEKLVGRGDMLFMHSSSPDLKRIHGAYVSDQQIEDLAEFWRDQAAPVYVDMSQVVALDQKKEVQDYQDELYGQVLEFIKQNDEISISMIQRQYRIGFNRSARLIEKLETEGLIAPAQGSKPRKVLR